MTATIYETDTKYEIVVTHKDLERSLGFSIARLGEQRAYDLAVEVQQALTTSKVSNLKDVEKIFEEYAVKRDHEYMDKGMGIVEASNKNCYSIYYRYFGHSHWFRFAFSKLQFGQKNAFKLATMFKKEMYDIENDSSKTNDDIDQLVEKFSLIKAKQNIFLDKLKRRKKVGIK